MGCDLSTFTVDGGGSPQHLYTSKVSPMNELKKLASNHFHSVNNLTNDQPNSAQAESVQCRDFVDVQIAETERESDKESFEGDDYVLQAYRPQTVRPLTRSSSIGSIMENRPPSEISNGSFTRVYRNRIASTNRYCIDTTRCKSNLPVVSLCSRKIGIQEFPNGRTDGRPCDLYWHNVVYGDMKSVVQSSSSKVNKFPGMTELAKKISLTHSISSMQKIFPKEYSFYPKSWFLPAHYVDFQTFYKKEVERRKQNGKASEMWFIVKPDEGAQGTGIYLINHPNQIRSPDDKQLVQEYVADPFLMGDSLKFDFRVYGVIRSINPLSMYVAREGMARFCTEKYEKPTSSNFENLFAHLTNYSLNKSNDQYVHSHSLEDQKKGSKRLLSTVFHQLEARGLKTKKLWHEIKLILVKTVLAMLPEIMLHYEHHFYDARGPQCFQIMGFDIMIREDGTPILLEVNAAPSLSIDHIVPAPGRTLEETGSQRVRSIVDEVIKIPLVKDTILLVLGLLDEEYSTRSDSHTLKNGKTVTEFQDDMSTLKTKRKPHLSEIFPTRYGAHSGHLLFLDKAMYIYMQFVQIRNTVNISAGGIRQFVRKCNLINVVTAQQIESKMAEINYFFSGDVATLTNGLPFHAFLQFMFWIAEKKFPDEVDLLAKMQRLMAFCDTSLRHYGVRSARLRRIEVDTNQEENPVEIYMLPNRVRAKFRAKSTETFNEIKKAEQLRKDRNNNNNVNNTSNINGNVTTNNNSSENNFLKLPRIKP